MVRTTEEGTDGGTIPGERVTDWQYAALTDTGKRRQHNEDALVAVPERLLWAVADGMGGHEAGDVASKMVVDALAAVPRADNFSLFVDAVESALEAVNATMRSHSGREFSGRMMGTTVVALLAGDGYGAVLWAGDSRLYRLRGGQLLQLTRDHSQVQDLVDAGVLSADEAVGHPNANVITRAIGGAEQVVVDVALLDISAGDRFLLCSDGLYNELSSAEIAQWLATGSVAESAATLLQHTLAREARDNVTLIVVAPEAT